MGSGCHELAKKYHSSESRILEAVSYLGIKRNKSESVKKQVANENPGLINFLHTPDYVLRNLASLGISKKKLAYIFDMAGSGRAYKDKISSSGYDDMLSHNKKQNIDYKYNYLRTVSKELWYTL